MPDWVLPTVIAGFAAVLWYLARRVMAKQDETNAKLDGLMTYMQHELRQFDVRLSVVETLVLPSKPRQ